MKEDLQSKSCQELEEQLLNLKKEMFDIIFNKFKKQNLAKLNLIRKQIARVLTILNKMKREKNA